MTTVCDVPRQSVIHPSTDHAHSYLTVVMGQELVLPSLHGLGLGPVMETDLFEGVESHLFPTPECSSTANL
jgi:hypothetical protein